MGNQPIRIAVDAMGGDHAPREIVRGAILGARQHKVGLQLVGRPEAIEEELARIDHKDVDYQIVPASEVIEMDEHPAQALRKKKDASVVVAAKCVKKGESQGLVAAGSTGAAMAAALFNIGRIDGIDRPAIGVVLPSISKSCLLLDAGANADCTPEMLTQFALMGSIYMQNVYGVQRPRVGLLNIGEEEGKGNLFVNEAFPLLRDYKPIHFIGNVEGKDLFNGGVDVAVCDGFTGNVALKSAEGVMKMFGNIIKMELKRTWQAKLSYLLGKSAFDNAKNRVDPEEFGGALLLGIDGVCVISHGGSHARGIQNAVRVAKGAIERDVLGKISQNIREGCVSHESA